MKPIDAMFSDAAAREIRIVWGVYRGLWHAYRERVFAKDVSTTDFVTLCGQAIRPRASKTVARETAPFNACPRCEGNASIARASRLAGDTEDGGNRS